MTEVMFRYEVPFGHRLMFHEGKCKYPHGHNYFFEVSVTGHVVQNGMVIDFSVLKKLVRDFFEPFDHAFVMHEGDPLVKVMRDLSMGHVADVDTLRGGTQNVVVPTKCVILNAHPTAENLASLVRDHVYLTLGGNYAVSVTCFEQRDCSATTRAEGTHMARVLIVETW